MIDRIVGAAALAAIAFSARIYHQALRDMPEWQPHLSDRHRSMRSTLLHSRFVIYPLLAICAIGQVLCVILIDADSPYRWINWLAYFACGLPVGFVAVAWCDRCELDRATLPPPVDRATGSPVIYQAPDADRFKMNGDPPRRHVDWHN